MKMDKWTKCDFQGLVTLTLTLDRGMLHTVMRHSSTPIYVPNFIEMEETFCGRTDGQTDGQTFETHFIRSTRSQPNQPIIKAHYSRVILK